MTDERHDTHPPLADERDVCDLPAPVLPDLPAPVIEDLPRPRWRTTVEDVDRELLRERREPNVELADLLRPEAPAPVGDRETPDLTRYRASLQEELVARVREEPELTGRLTEFLGAVELRFARKRSGQ